MDNHSGSGRFAPSPSGRMHLGNIFTALISWLDAGFRHQRRILRIEDLDPQRSKYEYARRIEDDLEWLGLHFDEGGLDDIGDYGPYSQSKRHDIYQTILDKLCSMGIVYPCRCTRAELRMTEAPHASDGRALYPGTCRPERLPYTSGAIPHLPDLKHSLRLYIPDMEIEFTDIVFGHQSINIASEFADILLRRADGAWAYQLAVVADDALMGVSTVVRGADLLSSAAPQIYLHRLLGFTPPQFLHVPLLCNSLGRRLSKRDGDLNLNVLRDKYPPESIIGYLGYLAGINPTCDPATPADLLNVYSPELIPHTPTIIIPDKILIK